MKHNLFLIYDLRFTQERTRTIGRKGVRGRNGSITFLYKHLHKDRQQARRSNGFAFE